MKNIFKILLAQISTLAVLLVIIALVGQIYTFSKTGYENLDVIPDRQLGWKLVPNSLFTYTGTHWYEREYKTQIKINSLGFRDKESHTLKTGTERFFFALLRVTILNKELDIFKVEEKKVLHTINA